MNLFGKQGGRFDNPIEQLEQSITANDVCDEKKMAVLLGILGTWACNLLCKLTAPVKPADSKACAKTMWILHSSQPTDTVWPKNLSTFITIVKEGERSQKLNTWLK